MSKLPPIQLSSQPLKQSALPSIRPAFKRLPGISEGPPIFAVLNEEEVNGKPLLPLKISKPGNGDPPLSVKIFKPMNVKKNHSKFNYNAPFNRKNFNEHVKYLLRPPPGEPHAGLKAPPILSPAAEFKARQNERAAKNASNAAAYAAKLEKIKAAMTPDEVAAYRAQLEEEKRWDLMRRGWAAEFGELDFNRKPVESPFPRGYLEELARPKPKGALPPLGFPAPLPLKMPSGSLSGQFEEELRRKIDARPGAGTANAVAAAVAAPAGKSKLPKLSSFLGPPRIPLPPLPPLPPRKRGGYRATRRDKKYLKLYKQGKSIGFTMRASLKAKGLIPRANGTRRVSKKYKARTLLAPGNTPSAKGRG